MGVCGLSRRCLLALSSLELSPRWRRAEFLLDFAGRALCRRMFFLPRCLVSVCLSKPGTSQGQVQRGGRGAETPESGTGGLAEQRGGAVGVLRKPRLSTAPLPGGSSDHWSQL